ncbi:B12-binding domain-containing radical SAM protein [Methanobacterium petrolearium]|uniref:B12-binding domain-containing radical SAM protein n=1 Tax=Methanobacterium petrolearium TaxID=710190 RepID=UPI001AE1B610|nr:cobalamin-dependent protein [Methanobacterium petrolearium]MBP1945155.1 radical SAM superfamily enzyme YgiQ (UPF0313 family) [Methanobacterium petrolearium]BDZ71083.1 hypothetical protein GCM10025861_16000 [Methanobacterium petrolearium]
MKEKGKILLIGAEDEENLAIRYLGAELKNKEYSVKIAPCSNYNQFLEVLNEVKSFDPDIVAVSMAFQSLATMFLELIQKIKNIKKDVHITVGGHFPTFEYEKLLEYESVNSVIRFEGETPISKLVDAVCTHKRLSNIPNLIYKSEEGRIVENYSITEFMDLNQLAFPLRDEKAHTRLGETFATLVTSRGCFHSRCIYCCIGAFHHTKTGLPYALRAPGNVAMEMAELYKQKNVRLFQFHDDNFLLPSKEDSYNRLKSLKKYLIEEGVELEDIALLIKTRPDGIDEEILLILEELGTVGVFLGVENASNTGLKLLARATSIDEINNSLKLLENFNMGVTFNLLMFHPRATLEEINENIYFMNRNINLAFDFGRAEIVAGSPLERLVKRDGLLRGQWPQWDYRIKDDAVEKMFRVNVHTFYRENSHYPELSHRMIALSYRSGLIQRFYPGKKAQKLKNQTIDLIRKCNRFTLDCLLNIYSMLPETEIEENISSLAQEMDAFYGNHTKRVDELTEKMWRFQMVGKKFQDRGVDDYFQNSEILGKIFRI